MGILTPENREVAYEIIKRYPMPSSATIPLLHLVQEQEGWIPPEGIEEVAELVGSTPAQVLGTCSFYEMFKRKPVGKYLINVCTQISCMLRGADELLEHAKDRLGIEVGDTTDDGEFTLEEVECIAACTEAPCLQVNYRYFGPIDAEGLDRLIEMIRNGELAETIPAHGVLSRVRQVIPEDRRAGCPHPGGGSRPAWISEDEVAR
ncbi:MAG: NADH-quinone oxidoreductase subunit E [Acidimicrobiales bacterium]|nr:MAG: NADH-quinone oxidoreductase subunit E [Acidimicrobiales bacterium]